MRLRRVSIGLAATLVVALLPAASTVAEGGPPKIDHVKISPEYFSASTETTPKVATVIGTTISYSIDEPADVEFEISRLKYGRISHGRCVRRTPANRNHRPCTTQVRAGAFMAPAGTGPNKQRFSGGLNGKKLANGHYTMRLTGIDGDGKLGKPTKSVRFTITPAKSANNPR